MLTLGGLETMDYMRWAKVHRPLRYELAGSGVPPAKGRDFDAGRSTPNLDVRGSYGDPELISAVGERYGVACECVVPVPGASSGNFIALAVALERGDRVMLEEPLYEPVGRVASFLGLDVVRLVRRPERDFDVRLDDVLTGLDSGARAVFLTNLHNPSGRLLTQSGIEEIANACARFSATLIVDEVYLDASHVNCGAALFSAAGIASNVIAVNSLTKVYGLGGLRTGWMLADPAIVERACEVMDLLSVNNSAPSTSLALDAFSRIDRLEERLKGFYREGSGIYRKWLDEEPLVEGYRSFGAPFECVRLPRGISSDALNERLTAHYDTQVVPGRFFGLDDHIRLSITVPGNDLAEALSRISSALRD